MTMQLDPIRIPVLTLCATILGVTALALSGQPQDPETTGEAPVYEMPTAEHKALTATVGNWAGDLSMTMPDGTEMSFPAKETNVAVGPFWIQSTFSSEFMGTLYTGAGTFGYHPDTKSYTGTWVDSTSSYFALMEGSMSKDGTTMTMHWDAPNHEGIITHHRSETVRTSDAYVSTFYMGEGEGNVLMVISMKRVTATEAGSGK